VAWNWSEISFAAKLECKRKPFFVCGKGRFETIGGLSGKGEVRTGRATETEIETETETCGLNLPGS
jgi:hypothetical protein